MSKAAANRYHKPLGGLPPPKGAALGGAARTQDAKKSGSTHSSFDVFEDDSRVPVTGRAKGSIPLGRPPTSKAAVTMASNVPPSSKRGPPSESDESSSSSDGIEADPKSTRSRSGVDAKKVVDNSSAAEGPRSRPGASEASFILDIKKNKPHALVTQLNGRLNSKQWHVHISGSFGFLPKAQFSSPSSGLISFEVKVPLEK